nr:response regulator [uncultured Methanospirillum sp.]
MARKEKPDLVLLDLVMPEMDGFDVAMAFRNNPDLDQIPIIGVFASVSPRERRKEFEQVCDGFVGKPISFDDLLNKIQLSLGITWNVVPAPSASRSLREPTEKEKPMVIPPEQTLQAIISLVKQGMFSGELPSILVELQTDSRYIPFCEQIYRFVRSYDDKKILSFIAGVRERRDFFDPQSGHE